MGSPRFYIHAAELQCRRYLDRIRQSSEPISFDLCPQLRRSSSRSTDTDFGFGSNFQVQGTPSLPQITVTGYFNAANAISGPVAGSNYYGLRDMVNLTRGQAHAEIRYRSITRKGSSRYAAEQLRNILVRRQQDAKCAGRLILGTPRSMNQDAPIQRSTTPGITACSSRMISGCIRDSR